VRFVISTRTESEIHKAMQLRRSEVIGFIEVGTLDILEKADVVRGRLAKYAKKLDESAFNNQVKQHCRNLLLTYLLTYLFTYLLTFLCLVTSIETTAIDPVSPSCPTFIFFLLYLKPAARFLFL